MDKENIMDKNYGVDYTIGGWYVYNKKTYLSIKGFTTRQKARDYAKELNNKKKG